MSNLEKAYSSKILLIGEYGILLGGRAFSMPYPQYCARWKFDSYQSSGLNSFLEFLRNHNQLQDIIDILKFENDIANNILLESNIPQGYGLGSSGSVVAAVYDRYAIQVNENISEIRNIFSLMESFFHGKSSGLDPLISYYNKPLLLQQEIITLPEINFKLHNEKYNISLVDSGNKRNTQKCVTQFQNLLNSSEYKTGYENEIMHYNSLAIESLLHSQFDEFIEAWKKISINSLRYYKDMIPERILEDWKQGIHSEKYYYKLCGAGGGGFFLKLDNNC